MTHNFKVGDIVKSSGNNDCEYEVVEINTNGTLDVKLIRYIDHRPMTHGHTYSNQGTSKFSLVKEPKIEVGDWVEAVDSASYTDAYSPFNEKPEGTALRVAKILNASIYASTPTVSLETDFGTTNEYVKNVKLVRKGDPSDVKYPHWLKAELFNEFSKGIGESHKVHQANERLKALNEVMRKEYGYEVTAKVIFEVVKV